MATQDHFNFIDQLADTLLAEEPPNTKAALASLKQAMEAFKRELGLPPSILYQEDVPYDRTTHGAELEKAEPWQCFKGLSSNVELAYDLILMERIPEGFSKENLAALALLLKNTKRSSANRDRLLFMAHHIALSFIGTIAPTEYQRSHRKVLGQRYGAQLSREKRSAKAKLEHEKRVAWAVRHIQENGLRHARKAIEDKFSISSRTASNVLSDAKKMCN